MPGAGQAAGALLMEAKPGQVMYVGTMYVGPRVLSRHLKGLLGLATGATVRRSPVGTMVISLRDLEPLVIR